MKMMILQGKVAIRSLDVAVMGTSDGNNATWIYNKLLKAFSEQIGAVVEQEMQSAMQASLLEVHTKVSAAIAMFTGGEAGGAAALAKVAPPMHIVLFKATIQKEFEGVAQTVGVHSAGKVIDVLDEQCTDGGVWRFKTTAGWSNLHQFDQGATQLKKFTKFNPRTGAAMIRVLDPSEVPLASAKASTNLAEMEAKVWAAYVEGLGNKKEQKAAAKDQKKAKGTGAGVPQNVHVPYATRLQKGLKEVMSEGHSARWKFSETELMAMAEMRVKSGQIVYK